MTVLLEPPAGYDAYLAGLELVPETPDWLDDWPPSVEEPSLCNGGCACGGVDRPRTGLGEPLGTEDAPGDEQGLASAGDDELARPATADDAAGWAVPGLWGERPAVTVEPGALVVELQELVGRVAAVDPLSLPEGQALAEAEVLLDLQRSLRVLQLARTEDVAARQLFSQRGFRSSSAWLRSVAPDAPTTDRTLAQRLERLPFLAAAVQSGEVSLAGAAKTAATLVRVDRYLDQPDGLVDGLDGEEMVLGVGQHVLDLICQHHFGLSTDDPAQAALLTELQTAIDAIHAAGGSQAARIEQLLVLLTRELPVRSLAAGLEDVLFAIVPSLLEEREKAAQDKRSLALSPNPDGTWELSATLTPECGERLHTALAAEARRDPANPVDTLLREQERNERAEADGTEVDPTGQDLPAWERQALNELNHEPALRGPGLLSHDTDATDADDPPGSGNDSGSGSGSEDAARQAAPAAGSAGIPSVTDDELLVPRSRSKRLHDALNRLLERYLSTGLGGEHGKVPVQAVVTLSSRTLEGKPGAPPGRGATGRPLARSLIRKWWCDAHVTTLLLDHGWTPLGVVHSARTITGTERKAALVQFANRCAGDGCCPGRPDPLIPLVPHHVLGHAVHGRTSLGETLMICLTLHHDLHTGKKVVRLRNGRLLTEDGYLDDIG